MTESIDMHCHWVPEALAEKLRVRKALPRIVADGTGRERIHIHGETLAFSNDFVDIPSRLAHMDRHHVRQQVLSLPGLFGIDSLAVEEAVPLVALFNDAVSALVGQHPTRFAGLAALPVADLEAARAELHRARSLLGLVGAILPADGFLNRAVAERFYPLFAAGHERGAHFFIHPGPLPRGPDDPAPVAAPVNIDNAIQRHISLGVQSRLSEVMMTLTMTDFLQPFGRVTVQVANLGGNLPWLLERMNQVAARRDPAGSLPSEQARKGRVFVDCASFGPRAIQMAVDAFGFESLLFGTDHPIFQTEGPLTAIQQLPLSAAERSAILHDNARSMLGAGARSES